MPDPRLARKLLLIGWDAADWKFINPLLDAGRMPNLARLVDGGVMANLATLQPCLSPILWTSIATGKTADKHGITGFIEPIPGGGGVRPMASTSRTTKAIWNILSQSGLTSVVLNWYASHPAEPIRGVCVSHRFFDGHPSDPADAWEVIPGSVHPSSAGSVRADLRMHPAELARPDLARLIPDIERIDLEHDPRPGQLAAILARTVSVHSVATSLMESEPWDLFAVYYDAIDVGGHLFMPYHPPRLPFVSETDFAAYQHVMRELYLFHDEMLGRLLALAGDDATVLLISDHGFHCDHRRPAHCGESPEAQAAAWHRQYGLLALKGPGILQDERIYGCTLLDVAPTVLNLLGLPVGRDMDGRPLIQAYSQPPQAIHAIPSWDRVVGEDGMHPADVQQSMLSSPDAVAQLVALGYLPAATAEAQRAADIAAAESKFNLAIVHSCHGRSRLAKDLLEELRATDPDNVRYSVALAKAYANLGEHERSLEVLEALGRRGWQSAEGELLSAAALFNLGQADRALARLAECEARYPPSATLFSLIGKIHLAREAWPDAAAAFNKALALDDDDPQSHDGAALAALKLGDFENAAERALRSVGLLFFNPRAHYHLGLAFKGMGELDRAIASLKLAVAQAPRFTEAQRELEQLKAAAAEARRRGDA